MVVELENRYKEEREKIMSTLTSGSTTSPSHDHLVVEYCRLLRQLTVAKLEENLLPMATAVGIAERKLHFPSEQ